MKTKLAGLALAIGACSCPALAAQHGILVEDIDRNAQACTDFYAYANGAWRDAHPIPPALDRWSRRWASADANKDHLTAILEEAAAKRDQPTGSPGQLIGDYYAACMDEAAIDKAGLAPAKLLLDRIAAIKTTAALSREIGALHDLGVSAPFGLIAASDNHNPGYVLADIFASGIGLPDRDYYVKTEPRFVEAREKYLAHVARMLALAGASDADGKRGADTVFALEKRLAEASLDNVALRDPTATDHKTRFEDLARLTPHFDWAQYFDHAKLPRGAINVQEPKFLEALDRELAKTPLDDWKVYLRWHVLRASADALPAPFVQENFDFYRRYLSGAKELKPRAKRCAENTDQLLGEALGQRYVAKYFPPEAKARMQEMVRNILGAMKDTIERLDWMDDATKAKALEKLATFNPKIGYPDQWKDYKGVRIDRRSFWSDVESATRWAVAYDRATIGKPVDRARWGMTPPTSDAYYNPLLNEIVFPAGILQPPAFDLTATDAVNYGAIGVVIGHEVSHGFDDQGAQYDAAGRLANWWTDEDLKKFQARGQCVVDQFESYEIEPGIHHNGKLVLGESIGDLAGAKLAFAAYERSREGKDPEPTIDGFTPEQQFFLAWGQWRGDAIRPETQRRMIQGDPHPIAKYRVNGPLSNLPAFQQAFGCKPDAPMVRSAQKRCEIW